MTVVRFENLKVGMLVAEDIFSTYGSILVNAGDRLDEKMLEKLKLHKVEYVKIIDEADTNSSTTIQQDQTVNPEVLVKFTETYNEKTNEVKNVFNQIVNHDSNVHLDNSISEITNDIIGTIDNQEDILKYIHKMKKTTPSIYTHSINVSILCNLFATLLDYPEKKKNELTLAGLLHDIGKAELGIDIEYNTLNMESLEPGILEVYKKHSTLSYRILTEKGLPKNICVGVLMHHETEKGTGFPTGAKWNQIHEFAKIIAIANFYDHMTFSGNTRTDINPFKVIKLLERIKYDKFDIQFVSIFLKRIARYYQNEWVELTTGEIGQIVFINPNDLAHPIVKIENVLVDLSQEDGVDIQRVL
ncbi:hypothetical protein BBF96_10625 [Anoxybacter fermentans]|uniref:HD-GYP domain-containing protein n=1 Tax=Anoxybacter fermentans TaxID=1323375 RepID=A0A3S9SZU5_9FIRM|nr:HD domain-containing phosphohydrolase [Anoxybacter fermentans]AZR73799.1 hypothetical protein BBF96_10625 [Anoxybacter fermentans]